eukprot:7770548-Pyramimonas_sp.AAC.1
MVQQTKLPLRLAGAGPRDASRTSPAIYRASMADALPELMQRFPTVGGHMLFHLSTFASHGGRCDNTTPACVAAAEQAGAIWDDGW